MQKETEFRIHWLTVTIWGPVQYAIELWETWFEEHLGPMLSIGQGGRGFEVKLKALLSTNLYLKPKGQEADIDGFSYFSLDIPGQACDAVPDKAFQGFVNALIEEDDPFRFTRLDLAWDGIQCHPSDFKQAVSESRIRSLAKRQSLQINWSPFKEKDNGELETMTVSLGSRSSTRRIKFYDKRGFTRVELETKKERADAIAKSMLVNAPNQWPELAISHLRDYIDIFETVEKENLISWWETLINETPRAKMTLIDARSVELNRMLEWVDNQVSPTLSVIADVIGEDSIDAFIVGGRRKRGAKYKALLNDKEKEEDKEEKDNG